VLVVGTCLDDYYVRNNKPLDQAVWAQTLGIVAGSFGMPLFGGENLLGPMFGRTSALVVPDALADKGREMVAVQVQGIVVLVDAPSQILERLVSFKKGEEQGPL
jgi:hypothetical protein